MSTGPASAATTTSSGALYGDDGQHDRDNARFEHVTSLSALTTKPLYSPPSLLSTSTCDRSTANFSFANSDIAAMPVSQTSSDGGVPSELSSYNVNSTSLSSVGIRNNCLFGTNSALNGLSQHPTHCITQSKTQNELQQASQSQVSFLSSNANCFLPQQDGPHLPFKRNVLLQPQAASQWQRFSSWSERFQRNEPVNFASLGIEAALAQRSHSSDARFNVVDCLSRSDNVPSIPPTLPATIQLLRRQLAADNLEELSEYVRSRSTSLTFPEKVMFN
jgi:hypothetical protein